MAGYHVENFGCRASQSDGDAIAAGLRQRGLTPADDPAHATVVVLNTCSVTADADRSARAFLRQVERKNPRARVLVTGCYAQRAPVEVAALPGVSAVLGNSHKALVAEAATRLAQAANAGFVPVSALQSASRPAAPIFIDSTFAHTDLAVLPFGKDLSQHTRPNLKVQDGCGNQCSFCIIPTTRGPSRSLPLDTCIESVRAFADHGGQELVLSGIHLGRWGRDLIPARRFEDLVAAILRETPLPRLRISSVEPMDWSDDLLALFTEYGQDVDACGANDGRALRRDREGRASPVESLPGSHAGPRLARHAHLPLQSGSDRILRAMHRRYRPWHYADRAMAIRKRMPQAAIGADVLLGFPGESETHFRETLAFVEALPFTYLHLFPFSARPGTPAWQLHQEQGVPAEEVSERMHRLRSVIDGKHLEFRRAFIGVTLPVVTLRSRHPQRTPALSDNFLKLEIAGSLPANRNLRVRITGVTADGLTAIPISCQ